jgi:hypothetical protein
MLTWAGAGSAKAKHITTVTAARILSLRIVIAFELVEPAECNRSPPIATVLTVRAFLSARPNNQGTMIPLYALMSACQRSMTDTLVHSAGNAPIKALQCRKFQLF